MPQYRLIIDLGIVFFAALVAGLMAHRFRQPLLLAYLLGGIAIGPHGFRIVHDPATIGIFAEVGVTLLMFALGVEFSLRGLLAVRTVAIGGGAIQIGATVLLGYLLGIALGLGDVPAFILGAALSLSSTMIVMKTLMDRAETDSAHGRVMLGILIVQDLAVVGMLALLPVLPALTLQRLPDLGVMLLKAAAYVVFAWVLARTVIPAVMRYAAGTQHKELFALTVVGICFTAALATLAIGFSLALGAFIAGLIVSESEYRHEVFAEVVPLRDVFAVLFFVSVGMLVDLELFVTRLPAIASVVLAILVGKSAITGGVVRWFGYHPRTAFLAGAGLAQIGEFSFLLARQAHTLGLIPLALHDIILSAALVTILLTPLLLHTSPRLYERVAGALAEPTPPEAEAEERPRLADHVIIVGYGRVGNNVGASLMLHGIPFVAVDYDQTVVEHLRLAGFPVIFGDGSNPAVLAHAQPATARLAVVTMPDFISARLAVRALHRANPDLRIVARVPAQGNVRLLREEGAEEVVEPEFEAGIEITRHVLARLGVPLAEIQAQTERLRQVRYGTVTLMAEQPTAAQMRDHYIICGYGRLGRHISEELQREHVPHVLIEKDPDRIAGSTPPGVPVVVGDATDEQILRRAGIFEARGLVAATSSDEDNLYITATARQAKPDIFILARSSREEEAPKLYQAGANRVVSPYSLGAHRMAAEILRPHLASFLDLTAGDTRGAWKMEEVRVEPGSPLDGLTLGDLRSPGVAVMGIVTREGAILSHPGPYYDLAPGDTLVAIGSRTDLDRLRRQAAPLAME